MVGLSIKIKKRFHCIFQPEPKNVRNELAKSYNENRPITNYSKITSKIDVIALWCQTQDRIFEEEKHRN